MLKLNFHYFKISVDNPEQLDTRYMSLKMEEDLDKYVQTTIKLKELLTTIKTLNELNQNAYEIYKELHKLIKCKYSGKSELNCFFNSCDLTISTIYNDFPTFKKVIDLYLKYRNLTDNTPSEWIQAIIDKGASRSKGTIGEKKLVEIVIKNGFIEVSNWIDFNKYNKVVARFKKNIFDIPKIKEKLNIDLKFNNENKMLDIILKTNDTYYFIEAKHLKESGGEQDKQISELIKIIKTESDNDNVKYCAFLDGVYSNYLLNNLNGKYEINYESINNKNNTKIINQVNSIIKALRDNSNSFWFNTKGFEEFIKDI